MRCDGAWVEVSLGRESGQRSRHASARRLFQMRRRTLDPDKLLGALWVLTGLSESTVGWMDWCTKRIGEPDCRRPSRYYQSVSTCSTEGVSARLYSAAAGLEPVGDKCVWYVSLTTDGISNRAPQECVTPERPATVRMLLVDWRLKWPWLGPTGIIIIVGLSLVVVTIQLKLPLVLVNYWLRLSDPSWKVALWENWMMRWGWWWVGDGRRGPKKKRYRRGLGVFERRLATSIDESTLRPAEMFELCLSR